ncbi:hypothetical protein [Maridesulfovibrio ferrireducens]|uniref:hypothetical protein n=1 Tax=Maridesulfovibrio ferrireducens TaxID=246191 RepID=UPI001A1F6FF4|nr:hypothetical protein [Maridesulfovibrio ferrireducens]MBI9112836.1 hypothetical protein [Maridesulfovibrio ferrireducens]
MKIYKNNFISYDKKLSNTIEARLIPVNFRIIRWNTLDWKIKAEQEWEIHRSIPDGWEPAVDFDLNVQGQIHRLTIHSATLIRDLHPYSQNLAREGKKIKDVTTRMTITSRRKINPSVRFEAVKKV